MITCPFYRQHWFRESSRRRLLFPFSILLFARPFFLYSPASDFVCSEIYEGMELELKLLYYSEAEPNKISLINCSAIAPRMRYFTSYIRCTDTAIGAPIMMKKI
ncbi:hypothetical protein VNO77_06389 [Canavalia gladiata]|uniref:Uncharacterized protein n=1 Tax=Canavalia gladiata TaxID=3824 RepID=A0AAN9MAA2_CANGL